MCLLEQQDASREIQTGITGPKGSKDEIMVKFDNPPSTLKKLEFTKERLLLMKCRDCTHTFYAPIEEITTRRIWLLRFLKIKPKNEHSCPICQNKQVITAKTVVRKKLVK